MGWKASMIIIENPENFNDDHALLKAIGKSDFIFHKETTLDECIFPGDRSINIGRYNGNIIICDDSQITAKTVDRTIDLNLIDEEQNLCKLFPNSENCYRCVP